MDVRKIEAGNLIKRAIDLEAKQRYTESIICYQEGLRMYLDYGKEAPVEEKRRLQESLEKYMTRAEQVKKKVKEEMNKSTYHEEVRISENEVGFSYESVFGRFLKDDVKIVKVEDPYILAHHQFCNFVRFCELLIVKCKSLQCVKLCTKSGNHEQANFFRGLKENLLSHYDVIFEVEFSTTIHDRQITTSSGWVIKIGRGLDYFKASQSKYTIGSFDMNLRPCSETKIDVYFVKNVIL